MLEPISNTNSIWAILSNHVSVCIVQKLGERGFMLSKRTATMHYVSPAEIYMFDFLLYHLGNRNAVKYSSEMDDTL